MELGHLLKRLDEAERCYARMSIEWMQAGSKHYKQIRETHDLLMECKGWIELLQKERDRLRDRVGIAGFGEAA